MGWVGTDAILRFEQQQLDGILECPLRDDTHPGWNPGECREGLIRHDHRGSAGDLSFQGFQGDEKSTLAWTGQSLHLSCLSGDASFVFLWIASFILWIHNV